LAHIGAEHELATFFEVSLDLLCIRDMDLKFNRANASWERVLGYTIAELEGMEMLPLVHPDDVEATLAHMRRMETEDEVRGFVNRYRHKDGGYRSLEWRAKRVGNRVYGAARDVTERTAMEADLEAAKEAAEAANKAKSDFLANISHEIRTPLNGVVGVLGVLRQTELSAAQAEMVELIENSATTLERLVSDLLDVSKIEAGSLRLEKRPFQLRELDGVLEIHRLRAKAKGLDFTVAWDLADEAPVLGDVVRIKQVLGNLLSNAVKFTLQGSVSVRIAAAAPGPDGAVTVTLEVADTGVGFDAAFADKLFNRFSQADSTITRRFGGTGLGLSICRSLVEIMGGEITAHSEPGRGALFRVRLTLGAASGAAQSGEVSVEDHLARLAARGQRALRILLAEDHPINRRVVQLILGGPQFDVTAVENGAEALQAFANGPYDLVLLDMQMPVMDGLTAARAIRKQEGSRRRTPIAMLTANARPTHLQAAIEAGADLHIAKPVTAAGLLAGIAKAVGAGEG
jgi:PAS domain S-box-containing protein